MDVRALSPIMGGQGAAVAASPSSQVVVQAPVAPVSQSQEQIVEARLNMPGIYLRKQDSEGIPRWVVMTALRAYGLNIENEGEPRASPLREAAAAATQAAAPVAHAVAEPVPVQPSTVERVARMAQPEVAHSPVKVVKV